VDEPLERPGLRETFEVCARFTQALTETLDPSDEEPASDEAVEIDAAGDDVAAGVGIGQPLPVG
jgi:hypothetical protein